MKMLSAFADNELAACILGGCCQNDSRFEERDPLNRMTFHYRGRGAQWPR